MFLNYFSITISKVRCKELGAVILKFSPKIAKLEFALFRLNKQMIIKFFDTNSQ